MTVLIDTKRSLDRTRTAIGTRPTYVFFTQVDNRAASVVRHINYINAANGEVQGRRGLHPKPRKVLTRAVLVCMQGGFPTRNFDGSVQFACL
jgi:hypothetical protein